MREHLIQQIKLDRPNLKHAYVWDNNKVCRKLPLEEVPSYILEGMARDAIRHIANSKAKSKRAKTYTKCVEEQLSLNLNTMSYEETHEQCVKAHRILAGK